MENSKNNEEKAIEPKSKKPELEILVCGIAGSPFKCPPIEICIAPSLEISILDVANHMKLKEKQATKKSKKLKGFHSAHPKDKRFQKFKR